MANETIEILKLLIENREESYSIRKISKLRKINYKSAYKALKFLEKEEIVTLKRIGNTLACTFNNNFNELVLKSTDYLQYKIFFIVDGNCIASNHMWGFATGCVPFIISNAD